MPLAAAELAVLLPLRLFPYQATLRFLPSPPPRETGILPLRQILPLRCPPQAEATALMTLPWAGGKGPQGSLTSLLLAAAALPPLAVTLLVAWQTWAAALMTMRPARQRLRRRVSTSVRHSSRGREHSLGSSRPARRCQRRRPPPPRKCGERLDLIRRDANVHRRASGCESKLQVEIGLVISGCTSILVELGGISFFCPLCASPPCRPLGAYQRVPSSGGCWSNARAKTFYTAF